MAPGGTVLTGEATRVRYPADAMATAPTETRPDRLDKPVGETRDEHERLWNVIVWNDPVTLMSYVVFVLRKLFGHDEPTATALMLQIHHEGKAIVASGPREKSESDVTRLHAHGLQATLARD
jgi:ATP-dependent Clp protease adaptor protein ClpS